MAEAALGMDQVAAVAVDRERHDRIREALPVPIEIQERVGEGVRHRVVQRLVGIGEVDAALDQPGRDVFRRLAMALQRQRPVARLAPAVRLADPVAAVRDGPGLQVEFGVVAEDAERRDDVLLEILVLVVAPDQHEIRVEIVEDLADRAEIVAEPLAAALRRRRARYRCRVRRAVRTASSPGP